LIGYSVEIAVETYLVLIFSILLVDGV